MAISTITNKSTTGVITSGTSVSSTSGTSIDFTGIPSWVKRITVMLNGVSTAGGSQIQIQIGSGSFTTSGYSSLSVATAQTNAVLSTNSSTGAIFYSGSAGEATYAHMVFTQITTNAWMSTHVGQRTGWGLHGNSPTVTLGGALDRVRITTVSGTDTFDAGLINIMYE